MKARPPTSFLLHTNGSDAGVSGLSPKLHGIAGPEYGGRLPWSAKAGCSGQTPVSRLPSRMPWPAFRVVRSVL